MADSGYVIVRREPTPEMSGAMQDAFWNEDGQNGDEWRAGIAASPSPVSIEEIGDVLEPFCDVDGDGEGDEDFPDDTPVTIKFGRTTDHSLTLGDFRRARSLLSKLEGKTP